jgi:hypothetical protein
MPPFADQPFREIRCGSTPGVSSWPMLSKIRFFRLAACWAAVFQLGEATGIEENAVKLDLD